MDTSILESQRRNSQIKNEYISVKNTLRPKLNAENIISVINSRAFSMARYGTGTVCWTKMKLEEIDWKTRKQMTIYGAQHPKANVDKLYLQVCEGGRGLIGIRDCVQVGTHSLIALIST